LAQEIIVLAEADSVLEEAEIQIVLNSEQEEVSEIENKFIYFFIFFILLRELNFPNLKENMIEKSVLTEKVLKEELKKDMG
jgi:hypothetical protein